MCPSVILIGFRRCSKDSAASDAEVLAKLMVALLIQMSLSKDIDSTVTCPVPVNDLFAKICDIAKVQDVVLLFQSGSFRWTGMERWFEVRLLWRW